MVQIYEMLNSLTFGFILICLYTYTDNKINISIIGSFQKKLMSVIYEKISLTVKLWKIIWGNVKYNIISKWKQFDR